MMKVEWTKYQIFWGVRAAEKYVGFSRTSVVAILLPTNQLVDNSTQRNLEKEEVLCIGCLIRDRPIFDNFVYLWMRWALCLYRRS